MYEQYTDKQIVEMLIPKMNKTVPDGHWDECEKRPELNKKFIKAVATIYRSAYIRGQLGRSFIIGEHKQTERWVPATKDNVNVGSKVRYLNAEKHEQNPEFYPERGAVGEVISVSDDGTYLIQWLGYVASWFSNQSDLEVLLYE